VLGLVKLGQCPPRPVGYALEVGQRGHAGDRPEHEPEDGFHSLFLPDHSAGTSRHDIDHSRAAEYGLDDGDPAARPTQTKAPVGAAAEPDSDPTTDSHSVHLQQACATIQQRCSMPAIPPFIRQPLWDQFAALLPQPHPTRPLGCHRPRIPDQAVFDKLLQVLVFGCGYRRIADATCSATTIRRRDEWAAARLMQHLEPIALDAYHRMIGLDLGNLAVDGCITKAPCGGQTAGPSPVDRRKQGLKRSIVTDARGIPLGAVPAPANRNDHTLLGATLDTLPPLGPLPAGASVHWTAAMTIRRCATTWPHAACTRGSPSVASPPRSRPATAGSSSVPTRG
jgi:transposase